MIKLKLKLNMFWKKKIHHLNLKFMLLYIAIIIYHENLLIFRLL